MVAAQDAETTPLLISKKRDAFSSSASWKKKSIVVGAFFVAVAMFRRRRRDDTGPRQRRGAVYSILGNTPAARSTLGSSNVIALSVACSPGMRIPFDVENYSGVVGAKLITNPCPADFSFESGVDMAEASCGSYELRRRVEVSRRRRTVWFLLVSLGWQRITDQRHRVRVDRGGRSMPVHSSPITDTVGGPFT